MSLSPIKAIVRAQTQPWRSGVELLFVSADRKTIVKDIIFERLPDDAFAAEPESAFKLSMDESQTLMDDLWACGLRPTEGTGSAGSLAATERHLADMRALVFKLEPRK